MTYVLVGVGCYLSGVVWGLLIFLAWYRRMMRRLEAKHVLLTATVDLENRRQAYDSGREILARPDAGAPARVSNFMPVRSGTLANYRNP